jgi:uncharacterized membrane protein YsdA (DUF1294 family)
MSERFVCADCHQPYLLSYEEQRSYRERGWALPKRCPACLVRRRSERTSAPLQTAPPRAAQPDGPTRSRPSAFAPRPAATTPPPPRRKPNRLPNPTRLLANGWANPYTRFGGLVLGVTVLVAAAIILWLGASTWLLGLAWLFAINLVTLIAYRYDKAIAGGEQTRVPEFILLALAFMGGSPAAYAAIYSFRQRHKAQKSSFVLPFWLIVTGQVLVGCGLFFWLGWV